MSKVSVRLNITQASSIAILVGMGWANIGYSSELPAVSAVNGKVSAEAGRSYNQTVGMGVGSLAVPLGHNFGAQFDAGLGKSDYHSMWGADGQVFWRDPSIAMVGAGYTHSRRAGVDLNRFLGLTEVYLGRFTVYGKLGFQNGDVGHGAIGQAKFSYYPTDDFKFTVGTELNPDRKLGLMEAEYMPGLAAVPGAALFARGAISGSGTEYGVAGFRIYFGPSKPLIRRHREDDPPDLLTSSITNTPQPNLVPAPPPPVVPALPVCCFVAGTLVLMADGTSKPIEAVELGELVVGSDGVNEVLKLVRPRLGSRKLYSINGSDFFVTPEHPFLTTEGWKSFDPVNSKLEFPDGEIGLLAIGDKLVTVGGTVTLTAFESRDDDPDTVVHTFKVSGNHTYTAFGYVVHNAC